ncbi:MAG: hypothetical protein H0U72_13760 [Nitrosospira sp.]|nr:hypothetical protein [Nitrosospira sp.]
MLDRIIANIFSLEGIILILIGGVIYQFAGVMLKLMGLHKTKNTFLRYLSEQSAKQMGEREEMVERMRKDKSTVSFFIMHQRLYCTLSVLLMIMVLGGLLLILTIPVVDVVPIYTILAISLILLMGVGACLFRALVLHQDIETAVLYPLGDPIGYPDDQPRGHPDDD